MNGKSADTYYERSFLLGTPMVDSRFLQIAEDLELAGLIWQPEIGDEVAAKQKELSAVQILVDPQGMSPEELRSYYLWLPTVEQMVLQFEVRQAVLQHTGLELSETALFYRTVIQAKVGQIESRAESLRASLGLALRNFLLSGCPPTVN